ncbi:RelA/SpoT domain-containing protein [Vibrio hannami]|uniref:RelA/SpoT domain-containing protein n=1 Tax=Vibrio hannami TaxID=2717094 RepID=UPI00241093FB|nr:RelA/SpoT domain-containing protein [Vibrio hannami]MDG3088016.1 RelA/SpoT domain-containing protein [Vibrio hannami]
MSLFLRTLTLSLLILSKAPAYAAISQEVSKKTEEPKENANQINPKLFKHSLSGLYGIENISYKPIQPIKDFDALYSKAESAQQELENICKTTALLSNTNTEFAGVKSKSRAQVKVTTELNGEANRITDLARATLIADDIDGLVTAYESLARETKIVKVKNRFKNPAPSGYRDLNVLIELPESKLIAEVQLHLKSIAEVKNGPEHDLYEVIQGIERDAAKTNRLLTEYESHRIASLRRQSLELYQNAWQPYITTEIRAA